tara:strand:- start:312 stop:614 length:303 start_codon:yes stop_codon:yes gene_type:complete
MNGRVDMKINDVLNFIDDLNADDLQKVINVVKMRRNQLHFKDAQSFKIGDSVSFEGRRGATLKGVVEKVKVKYILVRTTSGTRWNVPGSHLTLIKEKVSA